MSKSNKNIVQYRWSLNMKITSVLLAGGQNRRMNGIPKWELEFGKETMLNRSIRRLKNISHQIVIVSGGEYQFPLKDQDVRIHTIYDQTPFLGPLNGILTALQYSQEDYYFIVAADMPFFSIALAKYMLHYTVTNQMDIVIPKWQGKFQPLHGIYSAKIRASIEKDVAQGKHSLIKWILEQEKITIIEDKEIQPFNESGRIFFNMNDPLEYKKGLMWLTEEE